MQERTGRSSLSSVAATARSSSQLSAASTRAEARTTCAHTDAPSTPAATPPTMPATVLTKPIHDESSCGARPPSKQESHQNRGMLRLRSTSREQSTGPFSGVERQQRSIFPRGQHTKKARAMTKARPDRQPNQREHTSAAQHTKTDQRRRKVDSQKPREDESKADKPHQPTGAAER